MAAVRIKTTPTRMSATDAGFLYLDRPRGRLHIACVAMVRGRLRVDEVVRLIEGRVSRFPRYAQRPMSVPFALGHPSWEDDPHFDVRDHVQRWSLPSPGGMAEIREACARLLALPLDRSKPLWTWHLLEGAYPDSTAVLQIVHHCMADGMSGAALLEGVLDAEPLPVGEDVFPPMPLPVPRARTRARRALAEGARRQLRSTAALVGMVRRPERARASVRRLRDAAYSALRLAARDVPRLPWNAPLGSRRTLDFTRLPLDGVKRVCRALGGTVNDVVLCVLGGGLRRYLDAIGVDARGLEVTALVPVSLRGDDEASTLGNRISAMLVPLPVGVASERPRLAATRAMTDQLKSTQAWTGIDALLELIDGLPPPLVAMVGRSMPLGRIANVVATNVPGPRETRWLCGRRVDALYPVVPIADEIGLGLAVFSYDGGLYVGLQADTDLVPDLDKLRAGIEESFAQLLAST